MKWCYFEPWLGCQHVLWHKVAYNSVSNSKVGSYLQRTCWYWLWRPKWLWGELATFIKITNLWKNITVIHVFKTNKNFLKSNVGNDNYTFENEHITVVAQKCKMFFKFVIVNIVWGVGEGKWKVQVWLLKHLSVFRAIHMPKGCSVSKAKITCYMWRKKHC